jgi:hypothetical protein
MVRVRPSKPRGVGSSVALAFSSTSPAVAENLLQTEHLDHAING